MRASLAVVLLASFGALANAASPDALARAKKELAKTFDALDGFVHERALDVLARFEIKEVYFILELVDDEPTVVFSLPLEQDNALTLNKFLAENGFDPSFVYPGGLGIVPFKLDWAESFAPKAMPEAYETFLRRSIENGDLFSFYSDLHFDALRDDLIEFDLDDVDKLSDLPKSVIDGIHAAVDGFRSISSVWNLKSGFQCSIQFDSEENATKVADALPDAVDYFVDKLEEASKDGLEQQELVKML